MLTNDKTKGIGRIYTSNVAMAGRAPHSFSSMEEVIKFFGNGSDEANVAEAFFRFVKESHCTNIGLQFASWGYGGDEPWRLFTVTGSAKDGFTFTNLVSEETVSYASLKEAFDTIGDKAIISIKLTGDVLYISNETKADAERYAALVKTCGEENLNVTSDANMLNGFIIGKKQVVVLDLNGHKMCGDCNIIRNLGYMTINDSVGTGCVFTTNWEMKIGDADHSSKFEKTETKNRATTEAVRNEGSLTINGGWFGTDRPTDKPWVNEVNWGQCLACHGNSATIINGGHFTTVTYFSGNNAARTLAAAVGQDSWFVNRNYPKADGWNYTPYAAIVDTYDTAQVQWNGGECYGLYNDIFEVTGGGTTETDFGGVQIFGGEFYVGFKDFMLSPDSFGMQSMFQASAPGNQWLPSDLPVPGEEKFEGYSPIVIYDGIFRQNVALYTVSGKPVRLNPPKDRGRTEYPDGALNLTGRVSILGGDFNFTFSQEFRDYRQDYQFRGLTKAELSESKISVIQSIFANEEDLLTFGVFGFLDGVTKEEAEVAYANILLDRCNHIFCLTKTYDIVGNGIAPLASLNDIGEVCRAFKPTTARNFS